MAVKKKERAVGSKKTARVVVRDEPPLGAMQSKVVAMVLSLGDQSFGYRVLEGLMQDFRHEKLWIDPAQVYTAFRKLSGEDKKYIEEVELAIESRGPKVKGYRVTPAGEAALDATIAYYRTRADYLESKKPKRRR